MLNNFGIAGILVTGIFAQWFSWRFRLPSIVILLLTGFILGPVTGILDPDYLLGDLIFPFISLSVAIILFEGGLGLKFTGLKAHGAVIRNLITLGVLVSCVFISFALNFFFQLPLELAFLLGSILVVTGPTVIIPLLKQIHLKSSLAYVLRWEGIVIDPVGATLAVLIYEFIVAGAGKNPFGLVLLVLGGTLFIGLTLGSLTAFVLMFIIKKRFVPGYLQESVTLVMVILVYVISDFIQAESGLLSVTIMGIVLANQRLVTIKHIVSFKENLTILLLSALFIILAARVGLDELLAFFHLKTFLFLLFLIVIVRPFSVFLCTIGSSFSFKERMFLSCMAPRGIVAAAVSSLFALQLLEKGYSQATDLIPITFIVILGTVGVYGFLGIFLARFWQLSPAPNGILIAGAHPWARVFASFLCKYDIPVTLVDTNKENTLSARAENLSVIHGSILSKAVIDEVEMSSMRCFLALTGSDKTNLLAVQEFSDILGESCVYRLFPKDKSRELLLDHLDGQYLFGKRISYSYLTARLISGAQIREIVFTDSYSYTAFKHEYPKSIDLCLITKGGRLMFALDDLAFNPGEGYVLIAMCMSRNDT